MDFSIFYRQYKGKFYKIKILIYKFFTKIFWLQRNLKKSYIYYTTNIEKCVWSIKDITENKN